MSAVYKVESGSFLDRIMGWFDFGGDDDDSGNQEDSGGGGLGDVVDDVVDDVSDTVDDVSDSVGDVVDDAVDSGQEAVDDISEGAGDVADEVSEGDLGGAVDEAADTVEDVASGSSDTGSSGSSGGSNDFDSGGSDIDFDSGGGGESDPDPSPEPTSSPEPDPSNADPSDTAGNGGGNTNNLADQLLNQNQDQGLPETQEEVEQVRNFRDQNFILSAATPGIDRALDAREQNLEARNQIDQQINDLQEAPEGTQVRFGEGEEAERVNRSEALDRLEDRRASVDRSMSQNERLLENVQRRRSDRSSTPEPQNDPVTDIGTFLNPLDGNPNQNFREEATTAGVDLMQKGQEFGDYVGGLVPRPGEGKEMGLNIARDITQDLGIGTEENRQQVFNKFERYWPEAPAQTSGGERGIAMLSAGADELSAGLSDGDLDRQEAQNLALELGRQKFGSGTEQQLDAREDLVSGVATGGTQITGLAIGATGATGLALEQDLKRLQGEEADGPGLVGSIVQGAPVVFEQAAEDPGEFVAEETGEEVGEKIVFGSLTGGAGLVATSVPTPEFSPEVDPEFNPEVDPDAVREVSPEPENDPEADLGRAGDPRDVEMEDLPSGFTQEQAPDMNIEPVQENEVTEAGGLEIIREGEGRTVYPDQPRAEEFNFEVDEGTADARATPTEPDRVNDPGEFRGEDPRTQFTDVEQEIVREIRGREDVTIRQGETVEERGPGLNQPDPDQTVIEVEESETGGEMIFSVMGPVPQSLVDTEPDVEINPQPDIQGPETDLADTSPDTDVADVGPEIGAEPETEVRFEPEIDTEVEPEVKTELDPRVEPAIDQGLDQDFIQEEAQEFQQEQIPEIDERQPQQQTTGEPSPEPGPDKIMDFAPEPEPNIFARTEPQPEFEPEPDRTPDGDFGSEDSPFSREAPADEQGGEAEPEFRPSLEAVLFDVEGEAPADDEVLTGTEVRPIPEDMEEEFEFPF